MPATVTNLPFQCLMAQQRGHDRLALVVGAAEQVARIGDLLVDAVLRGAVPVDRERARLLHHRAERQPDAGRDDALHAVDLLLLHQLAEALDRVLGRGLLLDHELDLAAGDAALGVEALDRPLRGADAVLARRRGDAGARREDADAHRPCLRDRRREDAPATATARRRRPRTCSRLRREMSHELPPCDCAACRAIAGLAVHR